MCGLPFSSEAFEDLLGIPWGGSFHSPLGDLAICKLLCPTWGSLSSVVSWIISFRLFSWFFLESSELGTSWIDPLALPFHSWVFSLFLCLFVLISPRSLQLYHLTFYLFIFVSDTLRTSFFSERLCRGDLLELGWVRDLTPLKILSQRPGFWPHFLRRLLPRLCAPQWLVF